MATAFIREVLPATIDLGEKFVTLFSALKKKLWGDEQAAVGKLREVIDEILKFYKVTHEEISNFISMDFSNVNQEQANRKALYEIRGGSLKVRITEAKGSCGRIERIYEKYLDKWLKKKLSEAEYNELHMLFLSLSVYDDDMMEAATNLELDLQQKTQVLLECMDGRKVKAAIQNQEANRIQFQPVQSRLSTVMDQLILLKNELMELSDSD